MSLWRQLLCIGQALSLLCLHNSLNVHLWGGQVFASFSLPPLLMFSSVLCVCPAHPLPFKPPFTITIAACRDPLPCIALTTTGYWQGPIHCCNPPQTIKSLAGPAKAPLPCKHPTSCLLCLLGIIPGEGGRMVELLGLCTWFCQGWGGRGLVLCTQ